MLLTRYPNPDTTKRPLVMFHGYSAGGTTFAHHAVNPNFASHFWKTGRDVWIADLRTSSGQPTTAKKPWSFDQIGICGRAGGAEEPWRPSRSTARST